MPLRRHHPKLEELALANCGTVEKRAVLRQHLAALDAAELSTLVCRQLRCPSASHAHAVRRQEKATMPCPVSSHCRS